MSWQVGVNAGHGVAFAAPGGSRKFIGAERGIGRLRIESEARVALSAMIRRLQAYPLCWQQYNMAE